MSVPFAACLGSEPGCSLIEELSFSLLDAALSLATPVCGLVGGLWGTADSVLHSVLGWKVVNGQKLIQSSVLCWLRIREAERKVQR